MEQVAIEVPLIRNPMSAVPSLLRIRKGRWLIDCGRLIKQGLSD